MEWNLSRRSELRREIDRNYATGDLLPGRHRSSTSASWAPPGSVSSWDGPAEEDTVIFPHIIWDATLFWGGDLFENYEQWLIERYGRRARTTR